MNPRQRFSAALGIAQTSLALLSLARELQRKTNKGIKDTKDMNKRVRISNDTLNSYGTRVLTAGMNVEQYQRNPVLLYMHERGNVIGYMKDVKVEDGEVTGEPVFDCASELSRRCKRQWEFGSLKMVSAGLDIVELSEEPGLLVEGQTSPTISKSKLFEVSIVDIGANDDAIRLRKDGETITLGKDGESCLPLLKQNNEPKKQEERMDMKTIALQMGLPETATDAEITARLGELNAAKAENAELQKEKKTLELTRITELVEKAIGEKRLGSEKKEQFVKLGEKIGAEELKQTLEAMQPQVKLSSVINAGGGVAQPVTYSKLSEVPAEKMLELREKQPEEYKRLYKAEYGMECEI